MFEHLAHRTVTTIHARTDLKDLAGAYAQLDPGAARATFERRFTAARMAKAYVDVYEHLLAAPRTVLHGRSGTKASHGARIG